MATIAALGAAAALASAGAGIYGASQSSALGQKQLEQQKALTEQGLSDARDNEQYQRMVSALINQRAVAGQTDSFGSSMEYDPATNTWRSKLGALPYAAQTAADQAGIERNTTDLRQAQLANAMSARRATQAEPIADTARRELQSFRPQGQDELVGLLQRQGTNAANATFAPLRADTLRSFQRSGTAAGPVLAALGKSENDALRDTLIDSQIKGMSSVGGLNQQRRQGLEQSAANASTLSTPQFQYPGLASHTDDMAKTVAARAQQGAAIPAYGMGGVNKAADQSQAALANAVKAASLGPQFSGLETIGKSIGSTLGNKDLLENLKTVYGSMFGQSPTGYTQSSDPLLNYAQQSNQIESNWANNQGGGFGR